MVKERFEYKEGKNKNNKNKYKKGNKRGRNSRPLKCPYCNEREKEYLEVRGNIVDCLTCGNDSERY